MVIWLIQMTSVASTKKHKAKYPFRASPNGETPTLGWTIPATSSLRGTSLKVKAIMSLLNGKHLLWCHWVGIGWKCYKMESFSWGAAGVTSINLEGNSFKQASLPVSGLLICSWPWILTFPRRPGRRKEDFLTWSIKASHSGYGQAAKQVNKHEPTYASQKDRQSDKWADRTVKLIHHQSQIQIPVEDSRSLAINIPNIQVDVLRTACCSSLYPAGLFGL